MDEKGGVAVGGVGEWLCGATAIGQYVYALLVQWTLVLITLSLYLHIGGGGRLLLSVESLPSGCLQTNACLQSLPLHLHARSIPQNPA